MAEAQPNGMTAVDRGGSGQDGSLVHRHLQGDPHAFSELMQTYSNPIYGYLTRCGVATNERDDLFQEIFCKVHKAAASYEPERPLRPWVFTIAVNTVRTYFRGLERGGRNGELADGSEPATSDPTPLALLEARETARFLESALESLPLEQREVVLLCCVERLNQRDAAAALDLPINTVKTHLHRARLAMARALVRQKRIQERETSR